MPGIFARLDPREQVPWNAMHLFFARPRRRTVAGAWSDLSADGWLGRDSTFFAMITFSSWETSQISCFIEKPTFDKSQGSRVARGPCAPGHRG